MTCTCFDQHLTARLLAEQCAAVSVVVERSPTLKAVVTFTCAAHGRTHRHSIFPGCGQDWAWCVGITDNFDWRRCGAMLPPQAA